MCAQSDSLRLHKLYSPPASSEMGFSWQEHWSGLPFLPLEDLPDPGIIKPRISCVSSIAGRFFTAEPPGKV